MIRNVRLKRYLVNMVFPIFTAINKYVPKSRRTIFIYCSNGELDDNSGALFEYLIDNEYYKSYRIICGVGSVKMYRHMKGKNVRFIPLALCVFQYMFSGHVFYSMGKIPIKPAKGQCVINMWHGMPLKAIALSSKIENGEEFFFSYACATSELFRPVLAKAYGCPPENICICGDPKTDKLFAPKVGDLQRKLIIWAPTFRRSKFLGYSDSDNHDLIPLFRDTEWDILNDELAVCNIQMIVKIHPMQDLGDFTYREFSNLIVYGDPFFKQEKKNLYALLSQSDALISDFSSVPLEYLMLNRPICYAFDDFEEYKRRRGFSFDDVFELMPGDIVESKEELFQFIRNVSQGIDPYEKQRALVNKKVNYYSDGKNCERVLKIAGINK